MIDETALRHAFADHAEAMLERYDIGHVLYQLTDQVVDVLGVDGAGISLREDADQLRFVAATDERASRAENAQIEAGEGPCYEAFRSGAVLAVDDIETRGDWPQFSEIAREQGFRSIAGIPMPGGKERLGSLNLYRSEPRPWDQEELDVAQLLANAASGYILNWRSLDEHRNLAGQLQQALDSRVVIEQAKGVLVERHDIDPDSAFAQLRKHARSNSLRLHDVAGQVVSRELRL